MTLLLLGHVVLFAFLAETVVGFGSTILSVTLGAHLYPIPVLLPVLVPLNLVLSSYLLVRNWQSIDLKLLGTRVLPAMGLGVPVGLAIFNLQKSDFLKAVLGVFVVVLAALELWRLGRRDPLPAKLPRAGGLALLFAGGILHGLYGTGGPMVVYVAGRELPDKRRFRSTLSALWLLLNIVLCVNYTVVGALTAQTLEMSSLLCIPLVVAIGVGEWLHGRVGEKSFRVLTFTLLLVAGGLLLGSSV